MGTIYFEGDHPFDPLRAKSARVEPTPDGVRLVLSVVDGPQNSIVVFPVLMEPKVARELGQTLAIQAGVVERWRG